MKSKSKEENISTGLVKDIKSILDAARSQAVSAINMAMLNAYWKIWNARVPNLTWTHLHAILRVTDKNTREWYLTEASSQRSMTPNAASIIKA